MVVPGNSPGIPRDHAIDLSDRAMDLAAEPDHSSDLNEVQKLHDLVKRLEIQNQQLKIKRIPQSSNIQNLSGIDNHLSALNCTGVMNSINIQPEKGDLQIIPNLQSQLDQINSEKENIPALRLDAQVQYEKVCSDSKPGSKVEIHCEQDDSSFYCVDSSASAELEEAFGRMSELNSSGENILDETALDEVDVLELGSCSEDEEDCWLYVSPRKVENAEQKPDSPLKWCRQVLDHHSPETEAACRSLIGKLDQGYLSIHSALSSQSSVDSELSTSDDSISMGYKLQDLTDVQVMARLQEESLRQDYASSSASVSRRSSSASLHSLRRGTFSDQEFDTYSLEDEDDCDCSLSFRSSHQYSPSPLSSPRCQSPSAAERRATTSRIRPPRRSIQNPVQERMKYANCEDEMRHSMPNLAKTSLRSLEAVRSSRSLESDLQGPSSRLTRMQQPSTSTPPSKLRYANNQPALSVRQPIKPGVSTSSHLTSRQAIKSSGYNNSSGIRKIQSSPGLNPSGSGAVSRTPSIKHSNVKSQATIGSTVPKSKMIQPSRRSLPSAKMNNTLDDDSWKDGCY
ncbi:SLAIN motif-containing protein-like isoform X2 [Xenopus laevis]|uniref:SLAIN motif-containing protein-like isoform X2 n=1 Tax=Xenopus laevis TaxID=8355 RepID=A0A8J0TNL7_XENLA|nr:SLAIN motif-containing protein-like isoform X2 [Xenopus laevis]